MLILFVLRGCPYCNAAIELVKKHKITNKLVYVNDMQKDFYKQKHKMQTFPQIFYRTSENSKSQTLIGGYDDLEQLVASIKCIKNSGLSHSAIKNLIDNVK